MAEPISIQQLKDASLDVKSLEEVVNGDENVVVTTRLGETYPSVKGSIKKVFETGGLPATPFATKALMTASALVDGKYAMVTDDTVNNGLYVKTAGAWVKSAYDPAALANTYTDNKVKGVTNNFKTKALMTASALPNDSYAMVTDDTEANNGWYSKVAGAWVKSAYDPIAIFNESVDDSNKTSDIVRIVSKNDVVVAMIDDGGELSLAGINGTVQDNFNTLHKKSAFASEDGVTGDIYRLVDKNDTLVLRLDGAGHLFLIGETDSVQSQIEEASNSSGTAGQVYSKYGKADRLSDAYGVPSIAALDDLLNSRLAYSATSPIPNFMLPQSNVIDSAWVNSVTLDVLNLEDKVVMAGYQPNWSEEIGVVHPQVWSFTQAVAGYKYWLSINPYTGGREDIELPFIYGSNDPEFREWELIPTFPAPFEKDPIDEDGSNRGHLSDSGFTYDVQRGDLVFFWRKSLYYPSGSPVSSKTAINASSFDGKNWSEPYAIEPLRSVVVSGVGSEAILSPNIIYNLATKLYYMYFINGGVLYYRTSTDIRSGVWSVARTRCVFNNSTAPAWHFDIKYIGDKIVVLLHTDDLMNSRSLDEFRFGVSSDGINFDCSTSNIVANGKGDLYKASFEPIYTSNNTAKFRVVYTSDSKTVPQYQLYVTDTNEINLGA